MITRVTRLHTTQTVFSASCWSCLSVDFCGEVLIDLHTLFLFLKTCGVLVFLKNRKLTGHQRCMDSKTCCGNTRPFTSSDSPRRVLLSECPRITHGTFRFINISALYSDCIIRSLRMHGLADLWATSRIQLFVIKPTSEESIVLTGLWMHRTPMVTRICEWLLDLISPVKAPPLPVQQFWAARLKSLRRVLLKMGRKGAGGAITTSEERTIGSTLRQENSQQISDYTSQNCHWPLQNILIFSKFQATLSCTQAGTYRYGLCMELPPCSRTQQSFSHRLEFHSELGKEWQDPRSLNVFCLDLLLKYSTKEIDVMSCNKFNNLRAIQAPEIAASQRKCTMMQRTATTDTWYSILTHFQFPPTINFRDMVGRRLWLGLHECRTQLRRPNRLLHNRNNELNPGDECPSQFHRPERGAVRLQACADCRPSLMVSDRQTLGQTQTCDLRRTLIHWRRASLWSSMYRSLQPSGPRSGKPRVNALPLTGGLMKSEAADRVSDVSTSN